MAEEPPTLSEVLSIATVRHLADPRSFALGREYAAEGRVTGLTADDESITARVRGTDRYDVTLEVDREGEVTYECSCPYHVETGVFCKHCVAVALVLLGEGSEEGGEPATPGPQPATARREDVQAYLERQDQQTLVRLLMEAASRDADLYNRLLLRAAQSAEGGPNMAKLRKGIDRALETGGFVEYDEAGDYADRVAGVIETIQGLLDEGYGAQAVELTEYALDELEGRLNEVDDSDGMVGGAFSDLLEMHHLACEAARPDPRALAHWLFDHALRSEWDFGSALSQYADLLGEEGLAAYRSEAEAEWAKVPPRGPGDTRQDTYGRRWRLSHVMEDLAQLSGDVEQLVAIKGRDLSTGYAFLDIAQVYQANGDADRALEWAERGMAAFQDNVDTRLAHFVVQQYRLRGRHDEALAILSKSFERTPDLHSYQPLKAYTEPLGLWPEWRERALSHLRTTLQAAKDRPRPSPWSPTPDNSELVRILLWEGEAEAAWQEAQAGGCSGHLWLDLAAAREAEHPEDAIRIYSATIEPLVAPTTNGRYEEPVHRLQKIGQLMRRVGRQDDFRRYVQGLRDTYKRKRNFIALLDATKL